MQQCVPDLQLHHYDINQYPLADVLCDALSIDGVCLLDDEPSKDSSLLKAAGAQLQSLRYDAMEAMQSAQFQSTLCTFSQHLATEHFNEDCYFQKVPSIRLFLPGAVGTSWHTDSWYGHSEQSQTFWIPLTPVPSGAGVQFISQPGVLDDLENGLGNTYGLSDINRICAEHAQEHTAQPGEYLCFNGRTLHGSVKNSTKQFRCSIDFRGAAVTNGVGNKPLNNYRRISQGQASDALAAFDSLNAVKYINGGTGASTKYQHILLEAYAADKSLKIVVNEAEIETIAQRPVLRAYANRDVPSAQNYAHVLLYSMRCLPEYGPAAQQLLEDCEQHGITLHFALEDAIFPTTTDIATCLKSVQLSAI